MFDATLYKRKMFDKTKRSAIKLKAVPRQKVSSCCLEEPPISFYLTAYVMRAEISAYHSYEPPTAGIIFLALTWLSKILDVLGEQLVQCITY